MLEKLMKSGKSTSDVDSPGKSSRAKRSFEWIILVLIFVGIYAWQHRDLLETDGSLYAPEFNLVALSGGVESYQPTKSKKPALFYFFAPWCSICHASIENMNTFKEDIAQGRLDVFIIALDWRTKEEVEEFVREHDLPVKVLLGTRKQQLDYSIRAFPTYYVADAEGRLQWGSIGYSTLAGLRLRVDRVLE